MKYERLTKRADNYPKVKSCPKDCETISCIDCGCCDELDEALFRLSELEDKIEAGTLIELPCKVGDTVYAKNKWSGRIFYGRLTNIELDHFGFTYLVYDNENQQYYNCREVFLTKEQAEARLKELRGEL